MNSSSRFVRSDRTVRSRRSRGAGGWSRPAGGGVGQNKTKGISLPLLTSPGVMAVSRKESEASPNADERPLPPFAHYNITIHYKYSQLHLGTGTPFSLSLTQPLYALMADDPYAAEQPRGGHLRGDYTRPDDREPYHADP